MKSKKELKEAYRQMIFPMGVFQIRNTLNGKVYIDGSSHLESIWNRHRGQLKAGNHPIEAMQEEWNLYGEQHFCYEILAEIKQEEGVKQDYNREIRELTRMFIEERQPFGEKGYNRPLAKS
jgi:hypothetical protein